MIHFVKIIVRYILAPLQVLNYYYIFFIFLKSGSIVGIIIGLFGYIVWNMVINKKKVSRPLISQIVM